MRLKQNEAAVRAAGCPDSLLRTWDWYLSYCEGGFAERYLGVVQMVFGRPGCDLVVDAAKLPPVAADPYRG